ncbi:hypothetical protein OH773_03735 [Buttiauxella sp. WJP83]|uniref:hypothetical protein n=1 Tax=Buttiauxella sp. WJP83 TaxID=2986951 RepID=UPI0022DE075E|nr:hypothetical protein [Buttiauxella sp. WJP83]WBM71389.1 hypothetical protein OH773_03735 [Buttiauxella sp. WJP83]
MKQINPPRKALGIVALWVFRAYCLFFIVEGFRVFQAVRDIHPAPGDELATDVGLAVGGAIVFIPLLLIGALLFLFSWMTRGKPKNDTAVNEVQ